MVNAAGTFSKGEMQALVNEFRPQLDSVLNEREKALRAALATT